MRLTCSCPSSPNVPWSAGKMTAPLSARRCASAAGSGAGGSREARSRPPSHGAARRRKSKSDGLRRDAGRLS